MKRLFHLVFGSLAMLAVALLTAFGAMRLGLHGREVSVPSFAGLSNSDAESLAGKLGLNLVVENRFYSTAVPPNHVLSQSPLPGNRVRRGWQVRVTESLGGQRVEIPDVVGQTQRLAELSLRRLAVETGTVAHLPAPAPGGTVLAQSPPANSAGAEGPRVSLLVADEVGGASGYAFVMPPLIGLTVGGASQRLAGTGLRISSVVPLTPPPIVQTTVSADASVVGDVPVSAPVAEAVPVSQSSVIVSQTPQPGRRISLGEPIRVIVSH